MAVQKYSWVDYYYLNDPKFYVWIILMKFMKIWQKKTTTTTRKTQELETMTRRLKSLPDIGCQTHAGRTDRCYGWKSDLNSSQLFNSLFTVELSTYIVFCGWIILNMYFWIPLSYFLILFHCKWISKESHKSAKNRLQGRRKLFKTGCAIYYWSPNLGRAKPLFSVLVAQI